MGLSAENISSACDRYIRERDRYAKMTHLVEDICDDEIRVKRSIRAHITSRTKSIGSFEKKLYRFQKDQKKQELNSVDSIFSEISDLSGVRVSVYSQEDQTEVVEALKQRFNVKEVDIKDKNSKNEKNFYRAVHCQVNLVDAALLGDNSNLANLGCEIQVCSMMSHVWNEIEHDIGYKPTGSIGDEEINILSELGQLVRRGDDLITQLFGANQKRVSSEFMSSSNSDIEITSEFALQEALRKIFKIKRVTFDSGPLYVDLLRLKLTKYNDLLQVFAASQSSWDQAKAEIAQFNAYLEKNGLRQYKLTIKKSTDPALWLVIKQKYNQILEDFAAGRGHGRPLRIRSIALRYKDYLDHEKTNS